MTSFDANHAYDVGYYCAVRGIVHMPSGTWVTKFAGDWREGYEQAKRDGNWGTV